MLWRSTGTRVRFDSEHTGPIWRILRGASRALHRSMSKKRILYVDDDEAMLRIVAATLPGLAGVEVVTAATGDHALSLLGSDRFDLVLLDYELPDVDGATLCAEIRTRVGASLPVVFLSGFEDGPERQAGLDAGANAFLPKPSPPARIAAGITPLLRKDAIAEVLQ